MAAYLQSNIIGWLALAGVGGVGGGGGGGIGGGGCSKNTLESIKATLPESRPSPPTRQCCIIIFNMHRP